MFAIGDFDLIGVQLPLELDQHRACAGSAPWFAAIEASARPHLPRLLPSGLPELVPHLLSLGNLFLHLAHIGMALGVMRAQIGQLRFEFVQFLRQEPASRPWRRCRPNLLDVPCSARY